MEQTPLPLLTFSVLHLYSFALTAKLYRKRKTKLAFAAKAHSTGYAEKFQARQNYLTEKRVKRVAVSFLPTHLLNTDDAEGFGGNCETFIWMSNGHGRLAHLKVDSSVCDEYSCRTYWGNFVGKNLASDPIDAFVKRRQQQMEWECRGPKGTVGEAMRFKRNSMYNVEGTGTAWGRGSRGRGRGRGGGVSLLGSGVAPANYSSALQGVAPELREVVNILGERNQVGTLTGVGPPPGALDSDGQGDEEEGTSTKRPPRPLYRRLINYVRQAWTGVKFALDSEYEEEQTPRYRPDSLASLCRATRFTEAELKRIYRGFKAECPTGVVREETFKCIYSQFFPQGANTSQYAHYVFNTLDQDHSGILSFEDFVTGLSILSRGSIDEKLRWTFSLYDINGDGCITREEMTDIVTAVYELMGKFADPNLDHEGVREKVDRIFQKMDGNKDGVVTLSEFLEACRADPDISTSMAALDTAF
ncbi:Kv channel-interacting protein 4 [Melipona quadrifasciata]|uniref:Kv channel-interacting protein 4 n=2 Tax=Meliponini TaxID=83319 RepID=A0A0M9AB71_9HYME|nr:Kv channel-interacting protein 4 [Melipona quadrifasciata]